MNNYEIFGLVLTVSAGASAFALARGHAKVMEIRAKHRARVLRTVLKCSVHNMKITSNDLKGVIGAPDRLVASMQWAAEQTLDSPVDPRVNFGEVASRRYGSWLAPLLYKHQPREEVLLQRAERRRVLRDNRIRFVPDAADQNPEHQPPCTHNRYE